MSPSAQSDILRVDQCKNTDCVLYVDWDVKINFFPDFKKECGCGVYNNGQKDSFILWSGINQKTVFDEIIVSKNTNTSKTWYRAVNLVQTITRLPDDWYINYQTGLGR
jgi:hypothetical protein